MWASHEVIAFFSQDFMRYSVTSGLEEGREVNSRLRRAEYIPVKTDMCTSWFLPEPLEELSGVSRKPGNVYGQSLV